MSTETRTAVFSVSYSIGTYSGVVEVLADPSTETDAVIAKAKRILKARAGGTLPFGAESWVISDTKVLS